MLVSPVGSCEPGSVLRQAPQPRRVQRACFDLKLAARHQFKDSFMHLKGWMQVGGLV